MKILTFLEFFGHKVVSDEIHATLDHHFSEAGRKALAQHLQDASVALGKGDTATAAGAFTDILFSLR